LTSPAGGRTISSGNRTRGAVRLRNRAGLPYKDEESLIQGCIAGEVPAVEYVTGLTKTVVWRFHPLKEQTEDIEQEVHARLYKNLMEGRFSRRSSFDHYVRTIALYVCVDLVRRKKPTSSIECEDSHIVLPDKNESPLEGLVRKEDVARMKACLKELPGLCRDILRLRFWDRKGHAEIADLMGVALATSRVRLKRCIESLRDLFRKRERGKR
jgi:RNA polymerase sigma-70 factor (ECF subfamily)